jgi:hypothetical protein
MTIDEAVKRELSHSRQPCQQLAITTSSSIETEAGEDAVMRSEKREVEDGKVEGALHGDRYTIFLCMGSMGLWVYGLQGWTDSALFTISIYILGEKSHSAFGLEFLLQLDEAPA